MVALYESAFKDKKCEVGVWACDCTRLDFGVGSYS
jgi:hypothetical protein